jgi:hypothetical protein
VIGSYQLGYSLTRGSGSGHSGRHEKQSDERADFAGYGRRHGQPLRWILRAQGRGWKAIAREMKLGVGTVLRAASRVAQPSSEKLGQNPARQQSVNITSAEVTLDARGRPLFSS